MTEDLLTGLQQVILKERDPADYSHPILPRPAEISILPVVPVIQTVPSFAVSGASIPDASGTNRRPALVLSWQPDLADVTGIFWEVRLQATGVIVARGSTQDVATGSVILAEGILPSTLYQVRAQPVVNRPSDWTAWTAATTPAVLFLRRDLAIGSVTDRFEVSALGPFNAGAVPTGTVLLTYNHGPVNPGELWRSAAICELRNTVVSDSLTLKIAVETRRKPYGLNYSAWNEIALFDIPYNTEFGPSTSWIPFSATGSFSERLEDIQYRILVRNRPNTFNPTFECIRNVFLTVAEVTR